MRIFVEFSVAIVVQSFKVNLSELKEAILKFDDTILTIEKIKHLRSILPTDDEIKLLDGYRSNSSNLGRAEKFIVAMAGIPHLSARLEFFQLKQQLSDILSDIHTVRIFA